MCGIVGIINRDGFPVSSELLLGMVNTLQHRGPDGRGMFIDGPAGLGHTRLKIVGDVEQPHTEGWYTTTYNGELYDTLYQRSDVPKILNLYKTYKTNMFEHMNGMFAFGLWDQANQQLLLARDRFGEKPLYWYRDKNVFLFASEIKAIFAHPAVKKEESLAGVKQYQRYQYCVGERTMFKGIHRLEPATWMTVNREANKLVKGSYWSLPRYTQTETDNDLDLLADLVQDAVKIRLRADVPIGCYLSGGLDSSTVYRMAGPVPSFTGFYTEQGCNELKYAQAVNQGPMYVTNITPDDFESQFKKMLWAMDEPAAGPGIIGQWTVARQASRIVKVMLGGQGGDEIFGGYARYATERYKDFVQRPDGYDNYKLPLHYKGMTAQAMMTYDTKSPLQSLLHVEDRCSMAHGIETRLPLLDHRIAELVYGRPLSFRWYKDQLKGVLRHVARGIVPDEVVDRTDKMGFPTPFNQWAQNELRDYVGDYLGDVEAQDKWDRGLWGRLNLEVWRELHGLSRDRSDLVAVNEG